MKTKIYSTVVFMLLLIFITGCNDDEFLVETPTTFYTIENSFNTRSQVDASVTNMYVHIRYWFKNNYIMKGSGTDYLDVPFWRGSGNTDSNFSLWSPNYQPLRDIWDAFYQLGSYANQTLEGVESGNITWEDEDAKAYVIAQAKFFRGFTYMTLGELFGGVPLVDRFITEPKFDFVRSTREETYLFAIKDLEDALSGMPDYPTEAGRVAKGATYHYLAETYLALATEMGNDNAYLDKAIENATNAMSLHSLMTDRFGSRASDGAAADINGVDNYYEDGDVFFDLFQRGNFDYAEGNTEALWTIENDYNVYTEFQDDNFLNYPRYLSPVLRDANWNSDYAENNASPWQSSIEAYVGGRAVSFYAPTDYVQNVIWEGEYWNDMRNSPANIRRDFVCTDTSSSYYGDTVTVDMLDPATLERLYPIWTKFAPIDDWGYEDLENGGNNDGQLRTFIYQDDYACRLAETYLLRAEAYMLKNDNASAAADINVLRSRAHCSYMVNAGDVSIDLILAERARELFVEERRWCTLLRMGSTVATDQISKYSYFAGTENTYFLGAIAQPSGWNLWPIPQSIIDANLEAELTQNPGWN